MEKAFNVSQPNLERIKLLQEYFEKRGRGLNGFFGSQILQAQGYKVTKPRRQLHPRFILYPLGSHSCLQKSCASRIELWENQPPSRFSSSIPLNWGLPSPLT